ncbi:type VI secretion protein IcmF, partial [Vibrio parahaemolyticus EKP-008]
YLLSPSRRLDV